MPAGAPLQALVEALDELALVNAACRVSPDFFRMFRDDFVALENRDSVRSFAIDQIRLMRHRNGRPPREFLITHFTCADTDHFSTV